VPFGKLLFFSIVQPSPFSTFENPKDRKAMLRKVLEPNRVEPNRRKSNSLRTVGTVNRWNRMQNRTGGTGTVLPSSGPSPNKLIGKIVIAF